MADRYDFTGAPVTVTPPPGANFVTAYVFGGKGGAPEGMSGGERGVIFGSFTVTSPLVLYVGERGRDGERQRRKDYTLDFRPDTNGQIQACGGGGCSAVLDSNGKILLSAGGGGGATSVLPGGPSPLPAVPTFDFPAQLFIAPGQAGQQATNSKLRFINDYWARVGKWWTFEEWGQTPSEREKLDFIGGEGGVGGGIGAVGGEGGEGNSGNTGELVRGTSGWWGQKGGNGGWGGGGGAGGYGTDKKGDGWIGRGGGGGGGGVVAGGGGIGKMSGTGGNGGISTYDVSALSALYPSAYMTSIVELPPTIPAITTPHGCVYLKWSTNRMLYYSGRPETIVVPPGKTFMKAHVVGANGGGTRGGKGAYLETSFDVTPGETFKVYIGAKGGDGVGTLGAGGGGCSAVTKVVDGAERILVVAGGGGGQSATGLPGGDALLPGATRITNQPKVGRDATGPSYQFPASLPVGGIGGGWGVYGGNRSLLFCAGGYGGGGTAFLTGGGGGGGYGAVPGVPSTANAGLGGVVGFAGLGGSSVIDSSAYIVDSKLFVRVGPLGVATQFILPANEQINHGAEVPYNGNGFMILFFS
jgi:hypothetical protein